MYECEDCLEVFVEPMRRCPVCGGEVSVLQFDDIREVRDDN